VAIVVVATLAAGCSIINALVTTRTSLSNAGWNVVSANIQSGTGYGPDGALLVGVDYRGSLNMSAEQQAKQVAQVVWDNTPGRFSFLHVTIDDAPGLRVSPSLVYSHPRLVALFGPRPGNLDANPLVNLTGLEHAIAIGGVTALVVIILVTLLVVWLVRRSHTRKAARLPAGQGFGGCPPPPGYPGPATSWPAKPARKHPDAQPDQAE
jgi:hypothetical protein